MYDIKQVSPLTDFNNNSCRYMYNINHACLFHTWYIHNRSIIFRRYMYDIKSASPLTDFNINFVDTCMT